MEPDRPYTAVSLYSGAGGLDSGFACYFDIRWAVDLDCIAVETYNTNLDPVAVCGDVLDTRPPAELKPDLVIGGPPCQGFSVIGRMDPDDPRSAHVQHFLDVVEELQPRAFVMENVKALAVSERWASVRDGLLERAAVLGYHREIFVVNALDYGVPQARERMFFIGFNDAAPVAPKPTTAGSAPTVRETLAKLPRVGDPGNDRLCTARVVLARIPVMRPTPYKGSLVFNGSGRPLELDGPAKTLPASMGGNATPIIDQDELEHGADPWVVEYHQHLLAGGKPYKRTPKRMRRITIQESAALQTFPIGWDFVGPQVAQYRQIGNAVPPSLAKEVAKVVRSVFDTMDSRASQSVAAMAA